jgi:hypothetical protein
MDGGGYYELEPLPALLGGFERRDWIRRRRCEMSSVTVALR